MMKANHEYRKNPAPENRTYQSDLAKRLLETMGREEAIQSAREFHWHGVLAILEGEH